MKTPISLLVLCSLLLAGCATQPGVSGLSSTQADQILGELREIHRLLVEQHAPQAAAAPATNPAAQEIPVVSLAATPHASQGRADAPVVLVEYTDYQCPFCRRFHERTWPELKQRYVDTGKVRFEVRDMPLPFHDDALPAAIVARCAGKQGRFWPVFETLLGQPDALTKDGPRQAAIAAGVSGPALDQCLRDPSIHTAIDADVEDAERIGVDGTPGFVIARLRGDKLQGTLLLGAQPMSTFAARIDALLATPGP